MCAVFNALWNLFISRASFIKRNEIRFHLISFCICPTGQGFSALRKLGTAIQLLLKTNFVKVCMSCKLRCVYFMQFMCSCLTYTNQVARANCARKKRFAYFEKCFSGVLIYITKQFYDLFPEIKIIFFVD